MNARMSVTLVVIAVFVGGIGGCGWHVRRPDSLLYRPIALEVMNANWADVVVYVSANGVERRAGRVESVTSRTLRVPASFVLRGQTFRLVARELATGRVHESPLVPADEDRTVVWEIGKAASTSRLHLR